MPYNVLEEINRDVPLEVRQKYGDAALYTAFGCVLLEKATGKSYVYRAVNLETGQSARIHRKKNPVTSKDIPKVTEKLRQSPVAGPGRYEVDRPYGQWIRPDKLKEILNHIFMDILPEHGFAHRDGQIKLAEHILDAMCHRNFTLSEAEVGTGKTHAYLIVAALVKRSRVNDHWIRMTWPGQGYAESAYMPVVVSTSSIALQRAIAQDYIPQISDILLEHRIIRTPLTYTIRKGKAHYVCERNLRTFYEDADEDSRRLLQPLLKGGQIDLEEAEGLTAYIKRRIGVRGQCSLFCPHYHTCRYQQHMKLARSGQLDFQICNHNYMLADMKLRAASEVCMTDEGLRMRHLIPHYQAVIIDEGHKFLAAARQIYGSSLDSTLLPRLVDDLRRFDFQGAGDGKTLQAIADKLAGQHEEFFRLLASRIPDNRYDEEAERLATTIDDRAARCLANIGKLAKDLSYTLEVQNISKKYTGRREQMLGELAHICEQAGLFRGYEELIYWLELPDKPTRRDTLPPYSLCAIPKNLDELLYRDLWKRGLPIVLISGTLSASGSFTHVRQSLGIDRLSPIKRRSISLPSPFDHRKNALLYLSRSVPFPDNRDRRYLDAVADETERLIYAAHGHGLVLFTSYNAMGYVYAALSRRGLPFPLFKLDRGGTAQIDRFRESNGGVLFASGAMWEGIDIPGDALSLLIIVKLPFPVPNPISDYERTKYSSMEQFKDAVVVPETQIKLRQGSGRGLRTERDTCLIALLDCRMLEGSPYRNLFLAALPPYRITSDLEVVKRQMKDWKGPDYFV